MILIALAMVVHAADFTSDPVWMRRPLPLRGYGVFGLATVVFFIDLRCTYLNEVLFLIFLFGLPAEGFPYATP